MRLVFLGTPDVAVPPLRALVDAGHEVTLVVTGADKRRGRGGERTPSPVKQAATELGLRVSHDVDDVLGAVADDGAELGVVVAFGKLVKPHVLAAVPLVNVHFSLLPRWRGAAPVERAILAGDEATGVCIMRLEEGLDTGGIYASREIPIPPRATAAELRETLVAIGIDLLVDLLRRPVTEWIDAAVPQTGDSTYAAKLNREEFEIDWSEPPEAIDRLVRAGEAWTTFRGRRLKVLAADLDGGRLRPTVVQPEGKPAMPFEDWQRGARPRPDELFGDL